MEEKDTIPNLLEDKLSRHLKKKVTVINNGVEGYYIVQHYLKFNEIVKKVNADIALFITFSSDGAFKDNVLLESVCDQRDGFPISCARDPTLGLPNFIRQWIYQDEKLFFQAFTFRLMLDRVFLS